ncbi:MAG: hypothetical protein AAFQ37_06090, partial [Bacteroidota bacterium]
RAVTSSTKLEVANPASPTNSIIFPMVKPAPSRKSHPQEVQGLGFVHLLISQETLYFYPSAKGGFPADSLVVTGKRVIYAPSYLQPFYQKLDYDQLTLRFLAAGRDRILVELSHSPQRQAWMDREAVKILPWTDFLLQVFSVEAIDPEANPLRIKPLDHASTLLLNNTAGVYLRPKVVNPEWIEVVLQAEGENTDAKKAWLRWRKGKQLLVKWDYRL